MKTYTLDQAKDELIGLAGSSEREQYESELQLELIGDMIQKARKQRKLTQEELGDLVGVKKSQISRLENNTGNITLDTVLKVFKALEAKVNINIEMMNKKVEVI
ncbi:helix-turn-helix transcriptional regulator [Algoriphagus aquimarinus]|uniref:helix-turn-helix domain-containing protein n=1 Tax=Algoriphagus aquimarinus TaxID=237018 RepID=UPI0030DB78DC